VTIPHLFRPLINTHFLGKPLGWLGFFGCVWLEQLGVTQI
jgi:hypothetical protein